MCEKDEKYTEHAYSGGDKGPLSFRFHYVVPPRSKALYETSLLFERFRSCLTSLLFRLHPTLAQSGAFYTGRDAHNSLPFGKTLLECLLIFGCGRFSSAIFPPSLRLTLLVLLSPVRWNCLRKKQGQSEKGTFFFFADYAIFEQKGALAQGFFPCPIVWRHSS